MKIAYLYYMEKRPEQSQENQAYLLNKILEDNQADDRMLEWGGCLALENSHWNIAEHIFSALLERRKHVRDLVYLAQALVNQNLLNESEECLLEALNHISEPCPLLFEVHKLLGHICLKNKNYPMAEEYYNKAYTFNPDSEFLLFHLGLLKIKEKKYKEAEHFFQMIVKDTPEFAKAWFGLAVVRHFLEDQDLAHASLSRCLDLDPSNQQAQKLREKWNPYYFFTPVKENFKFSA